MLSSSRYIGHPEASESFHFFRIQLIVLKPVAQLASQAFSPRKHVAFEIKR